MADVQPLKALHYNLEKTGDLQSVVSPPYDVIDAQMRERLESQSPYNVVRIDLPVTSDGSDVYAHAAALLESWQADDAVVADTEAAIWPLEQDYVGPDGRSRTRRGFLARVRVEEYGPGRIRPHERTHPGPKEDRLRLTRATRANLSPIFALYSTRSSWPGRHLLLPWTTSHGRRRSTRTAPSTGSGGSATPRRSPRSRQPLPTLSC